MIWLKLLGVGIGVLAAILGAWVVRSDVRRRRQYDRIIRQYQSAPPDKRKDVLGPAADGVELNPAAWYLRGALAMREGRMRDAARSFGMAHHADCRLQTAALLTFAGLKASEGEGSDIIEQVVRTWEEMGRPAITAQREDRVMMDCLETEGRAGPELSAVGRLVWLMVGPAQRARIEPPEGEDRGGRPGWAAALRS